MQSRNEGFTRLRCARNTAIVSLARTQRIEGDKSYYEFMKKDKFSLARDITIIRGRSRGWSSTQKILPTILYICCQTSLYLFHRILCRIAGDHQQLCPLGVSMTADKGRVGWVTYKPVKCFKAIKLQRPVNMLTTSPGH